MRLTLVFLLMFPFPVGAQTKAARLAAERKEFADSIRQLRKELQAATEEYKESLRQLIGHYERDRERSLERLKQTRELYDANVARARDLEEAKKGVADAEAKLASAKSRLEHADDELNSFNEDPDELARRLITQPAKRERTPAGRVYYVRFIVIGEIMIYDYSGAVSGRVIKHKQRVKYDSRKK